MALPPGILGPGGVGVIDTMIGFPDKDFAVYDFIRNQLKDGESTDFEATSRCDVFVLDKAVRTPT